MNKFGFITSLAIMMFLPVLAYFVMEGLLYIVPPSGDWESFYYYSIVMVVLLVTPYFVLKFLFHAAHIKDINEPELHFQDLPKSQEKNDSERNDEKKAG